MFFRTEVRADFTARGSTVCGADPRHGWLGVSRGHDVQHVAVLNDVPQRRDREAVNFGKPEVQANLFVEFEAGVEQSGAPRKVVDASVFKKE